MITGDFLGMSLTTALGLFQESRAATAAIVAKAVGLGGAICPPGPIPDAIQPDALRTLAFVVIVFGNQATMHTNRERRHLWSSRPSFWIIVSSIADLLIAVTLAIGGIAMRPLPAWAVALRLSLPSCWI